MRVYLAAPYGMKDVIKARALELERLGISVVSQWTDESHSANIQMHELTHEEHQAYAVRDVAECAQGDVFVLQPNMVGEIVRQGRTSELGIAIGIGLYRPYPIFVVGDGGNEANIFHHLPQVTHFPDWEATKAELLALLEIERISQDEIPF